MDHDVCTCHCDLQREQRTVEEKLESWRYALERRGMNANRRKTEYMCVNERQDMGTGKCEEKRSRKWRISHIWAQLYNVMENAEEK